MPGGSTECLLPTRYQREAHRWAEYANWKSDQIQNLVILWVQLPPRSVIEELEVYEEVVEGPVVQWKGVCSTRRRRWFDSIWDHWEVFGFWSYVLYKKISRLDPASRSVSASDWGQGSSCDEEQAASERGDHWSH